MQGQQPWIWLPTLHYPENQTTICSGFADHRKGNYTVAEFTKAYSFDKTVRSVKLVVSGDSLFRLLCNGVQIATGPAAVGGDFRGNESPRPNYYSHELEIFPDSCRLLFQAQVQMMPVQLCDYSMGHGGFMLTGHLTFVDGTESWFSTDESWLVRRDNAYISPLVFDNSRVSDGYVPAELTPDIWHCKPAPIPVREEKTLYPEGYQVSLLPNEEKELVLELDRIYAGFPCVCAVSAGRVSLQLYCREREEMPEPYQVTIEETGCFRGFQLCSAGNLFIKLKNDSAEAAQVEITFVSTCYPVTDSADTVTDDEELNQLLQVCKHSLKYCRQTHHLDSPRHCEPLACTGDYYIESLMTLFSFGDMRLAEFDIQRTAVTLEHHDGRLFHTTYSLIWVKMLYDVYQMGGNRRILFDSLPALALLLKRFEGYMGSNGLIEQPPDYMFVDWIYLDGYSLHHPPKALGQTCLNMFYYGALAAAEKIYEETDLPDLKAVCRSKKIALRNAINQNLFDQEKQVYFEGCNTPTPEHMIGQWMPKNTGKRYCLKHSNVLAAYFGVCEDSLAAELVRKVMQDDIPGECQPYFLHYLFEAIYRLGLRESYTMELIERWKPSVKEFPKGLVEGFTAPEPSYSFDHSHAWAGTPLYSLPKALLGLEILDPGMKRVRLSPNLLGLDYFKSEFMTPFGKVSCEVSSGGLRKITHPKEIQIIWNEKRG